MSTRKFIALLLIALIIISGCAHYGEIAGLPDMPLYHQAVMINNVRYIPLLRFCDYYDLDYDWELVSQRIEVKKDGETLVLRPNSGLMLVNNKIVKSDYAIEYKNGAVYIPVNTARFLSEDVFGLKERPAQAKMRHRIETVIIDPGHGGKDPGAVGKYGIKEKNVVLDVSKRLKRDLEKNGLTVYLTREKDIFIPLYKRAKFANNKKADLFISIHANASRYSRAKGFEVYYLSEATDDNARALAAAENASLKFEEITANENTPTGVNQTAWDLLLSENRRESKELAYYMCNITSDRLGMRKRGVKGARFVVLKGAIMPAVLVEVGFLTNRREASKLKKTSFREKIAGAISYSILAYKKEYERTNGFSR